MRVWSSTDDGATWTPQPVARDGEHWRVRPSASGGSTVSLRVAAAAVTGETVDQTVIRAYSTR